MVLLTEWLQIKVRAPFFNYVCILFMVLPWQKFGCRDLLGPLWIITLRKAISKTLNLKSK